MVSIKWRESGGRTPPPSGAGPPWDQQLLGEKANAKRGFNAISRKIHHNPIVRGGVKPLSFTGALPGFDRIVDYLRRSGQPEETLANATARELIENVETVGSALAGAQFFLSFIEEDQCIQSELAERFGYDQSHISNRLRLLRLPSEIKDLIRSKKIGASHAIQFIRLENRPGLMVDIARRVAEEGWPVNRLVAEVRAILGDPPKARRYYRSKSGRMRR